jgi:hypothetical protein
MIKEKILKFEGKIKDKTKFGSIREIFFFLFFERKWQFFEKTRRKVSRRGLTAKGERRERPLEES